MLPEGLVEQAARDLLPGCKARMGYRITWDDFLLQVNYRDETTKIELYPKDLMLSLDAFTEMLKARLPADWFPKPSSADAIDFDKTG
jgi:hypothetical protein